MATTFVVVQVACVFASDSVTYNQDILPILSENCFSCHGFDKGAREAGLRLDSLEGATQVLDSGEIAIQPGNIQDSALIFRILSDDPDVVMPPASSGKSLTTEQKETLQLWIAQGAKYEAHWAFIPPKQTEPPQVGTAIHPIDRFVQARLKKEKLEPSPAASRETLIRRLSIDLTGLPPTIEEVESFLYDTRPNAYELLVDRLLHSEHFGEHWARWWLDLAHYADSDGYLQDFIRPVAWRYRQWVIDAFNREQPFDQFTIEQLAGDLISDATTSQRMATGFLRNTLSNREGGADLEEFRVRQVIDRTSTTATTWLALTFACAECHDHKFDPISQREFYQLYAFFNTADEVNFDAPLPGEGVAWEKGQEEYHQQRTSILAQVAKPLGELQAEWEKKILYAELHPGDDFAWDRELELLGLQWGQDLGEGQLEGLNILKIPMDQRNRDQQDRVLDYFLKRVDTHFGDQAKVLELSKIQEQLVALQNKQPKVTRAPGMMQCGTARESHVHIRGNYLRLGEKVAPDTPSVLPDLQEAEDANRLTLARWLVSPEHPLTARVAVNRIWQKLFGRGIVASSENFGVRGERPSHPELLDWLALEFQRQEWSMKKLIRTIVMSETYRQSSETLPIHLEYDPENRLLARQSRIRFSAEMVRDSALAVSGLLSRKIGGPCVKPQQPASVPAQGYRNQWETSAGSDRYRRGIYTFIQRTSPFAQLVTFDFPNTSRCCTLRERSNTPLQALNLLNDPVFHQAAQSLATKILESDSNDESQRLNFAFMQVISRPASEKEADILLDYLHQQREWFLEDASRVQDFYETTSVPIVPEDHAAWSMLASVIMNLDEAITRE